MQIQENNFFKFHNLRIGGARIFPSFRSLRRKRAGAFCKSRSLYMGTDLGFLQVLTPKNCTEICEDMKCGRYVQIFERYVEINGNMRRYVGGVRKYVDIYGKQVP